MVSLVTLKYFFFFNDTATTEIYTLSLHDALPISKPNTTGTIKVPASLRSERCSPSARNAVRVPVGISVRLRRNPHQGSTSRISTSRLLVPTRCRRGSDTLEAGADSHFPPKEESVGY